MTSLSLFKFPLPSCLFSGLNNKSSECTLITSLYIYISLSLPPTWLYSVIAILRERGTRLGGVISGSVHHWWRSSCPLGPQEDTVWMFSVEVAQQCILGRSCKAALFTDVQLVAALLVSVLLQDTMNLLHVGLQRAALSESLLTETALVRTNTYRWNRKILLFEKGGSFACWYNTALFPLITKVFKLFFF